MTKTTTIQTAKVTGSGYLSGYTVRLQQRGKSFDVIYNTGFCWKYVVKAASEAAARSEFFLLTVGA